MANIIQLIQSCSDKMNSLQNLIPVKQYKDRVSELDSFISSPSLWLDSRKASLIMKERQKLSDLLEKIEKYQSSIGFYKECINQFPQELDSFEHEILAFFDEISLFEFHQMMSDPVDNSPAILSINAGAGGLESENWVTMLLRMYMRYADNNSFNIETLDFHPSDEYSSICTNSVSLKIDGPYAFGLLKGESGVHRLIRNSPFNAGDARHTSFAAISVMPDIEDTIDIKIEDKDLEITAQRSASKGGQNVNKVSSAIRLKHIPTGINILARTERDQLANRKIAFKILKAKLYDLEKKKRDEEKNKIISAQSDISFGHQVRTYTFSPYSLVKDHRTSYENSNIQSFLDGNIDSCIHLFLLKGFNNHE